MRHEILPLDVYRLAETGDKPSRNKIVEYHLPMVKKFAEKYEIEGFDREDLVQEGALALIRAVEKFDWRKGYGFSTYATWWLRHRFDALTKKKKLQTEFVGDEWYKDTEKANVELANILSALDVLEEASLISDVDRLVLALPNTQRSVVVLKYGLFDFTPQPIAKISDILEIAKEEVKELSDQAEETLRKSSLGAWL